MFVFSLGYRREIVLLHVCVLTVNEEPVTEFRCKNPSGTWLFFKKRRTPMLQQQKVFCICLFLKMAALTQKPNSMKISMKIMLLLF